MNEQKYSDLVASMPVAYSLHEMLYNDKGEAVDYRFLDVNAAFEELTGLVATEVIGKTLLEMLPESEPFWIQKYAKCVLSGELQYFENYSKALKKHYHVIAYKYGENRFVSMFMDINNRKMEFKKAEEVASFYQTITENASDGVVILDETWRYSYASPNAFKMFGYNLSELRTLVPEELSHPDDFENLNTEIQKTFQDPDYKPTLEYRFRKKDGEWIWLESKFSNLFNHPVVNGLVINFKNITERRAKEQKLKQSEALLAATLIHSRFSIWSVDINYHLLYANDTFKDGFLQTFGVELKVGMRLIEVLPEQVGAIWLDRYKRTFANNSFLEEDIIEVGNQKIYIEVSSTPIIVDGVVVGASFYGENITERKEAEIKLVQNAENLSKILNASNQFVKPKLKDVDFDEVTGVLRQISGAKYVIFNRLYADYSKTISLSGLDKSKETIKKYLNVDISDRKWKREATFESKWMQNKLTVMPDIGSILFTDFQPAVIQSIIKIFNIGNVVVMRIEGNERIVGNLIFIFERGKSFENNELIEMYTYQLGQYIERLNAEEALHSKVSEMERFHKLTVNRELNMIELKKEVNELLQKMGQNEKYRIVN